MQKNQIKFIEQVHRKKNFSDAINFISEKFPNKTFLIFENIKITFKEFNFLINKTCNYFKNQNIKEKDIISICLKNSIESIIIYFSCIRYGVICSPIPYGVSEDSLKHFLKLSKSKFVFSNQKISNKNFNNIILNDYNDFLKKIGNCKDYFKNKKINGDNTAVYYFSSGTTAKPKLIKYSHNAMIACQKILFESNYLNPFSIHMCLLPLGHTASLRYSIKNAIMNAGKVYLYKNFWEVKDSFWKEIKNKKINFVGVVPTIIQTLLYSHGKKKLKPKYLNFIGCGSSILSEELQKKFEKKFKIPIANIYGMSEIGVATIENNKINKEKGTIGKPLKKVNIKLFDKKNFLVNKDNVSGEICIKSPALFSGYIPKNKMKKNNFIKKYFRTGDLALWKDGNLKFLDRSKDIIIKGGVNIAPQEVDKCLQENINVSESATIGIKDNFFGEKILSYVVLKKYSKIKKSELLKYCENKIGKFRTPENIIFKNKLPKTASGKVIKRFL